MKFLPYILLLFLASCKSSEYEAPAISEVKSVTIIQDFSQSTIAEAKLLDKHSYSSIKAALDGAKIDNRAAKWEFLGAIEMQFNSGKQTLEIFQTYEDTGAFKINEVYYRGADDKSLAALLKL